MPLRKSYEFIKLERSKNCYLLSRFPALTTLVHPRFESEVMELSSSSHPPYTIEQFREFGELETQNPGIPYYIAFYLFLKQHNFFENLLVESLRQFNFFPEDIRSFIASTGNITFEVTEKCNLKCKYCGFGKLYDSSVVRGRRNLKLQLAKNLIDFVWMQRVNNGTNSPLFISFYGGEPFLNFNLIKQIIGYVKKNPAIDDKLIKFRITTNGTKLEKYLDTLVSNDIFLTVSLDGDRVHNRYRTFADGKESFDLVYQQLLILKRKYPDYFRNHVDFNSILTDISNLKEIELFFHRNFHKTLKVSELSLVGVKKETYERFRKMYRTVAQTFRDSLDRSKHIKKHPVSLRLFNLLVSHSDNFIFNSKNQQSKGRGEKNIRTGTCNPFQKKIFCTVDGNLLPCEKIPRNFVLGKVTESLIEIDFEGLCKQFCNWNSKISNMCMQCCNGLNCLNCLFFIDFSGEKPKCNKFNTHNTYWKKIHDTLELIETNPNIYKMLFERK